MIFTSKNPSIPLPNTDLTSVVLRRVAELGDRPALVEGPTGRTLSFNDLANQVKQFSSGLAQRGFKKGDVFAIFIPNMPEYAVVFLGVASAGGINTTVNSLYSTEDLIHQFTDSKAKYLLTIPAFLDRALPAAKACGIEEIFILGEAPEGTTPFVDLLANEGNAPSVEIDPQKDLVALPYSSGTTGAIQRGHAHSC